MTDPAQTDPDQLGPGPPPSRSRTRTIVGVAFFVLVTIGILVTVFRERDAFADTVRRVGAAGLLVSLLFGIVGVGLTGVQWRTVLAGLEIRLRLSDALQVFFVTQLGKYLPGSVWPIVMQMEAGSRRGAGRPTMLAANIISIVINLAVGLVLAGALLPFTSPEALSRYWWALAALPLVVVLALPRTLPWLLDKALVLARRKPLGVTTRPSAVLAASGWSALSWLAVGLHLVVLVAAIDGFSWSLVALCVGGMSLAFCAGTLFLPAPAGAGIREVILGLVLSAVISPAQAVAVVVASRVVLIVTDLLLAGVAVLMHRVLDSGSARV